MSERLTDAIWELYRSYRSGRAPFVPVAATLVATERPDVVPLFRAGAGVEPRDADAAPVEGCEAHGGRSAWIRAPWHDARGSYPGFEYKGAGSFDGTATYIHPSGPYDIIVGGQRLDWAVEEFETTRLVGEAGVDAQRAIALFRLSIPSIPMEAGIFVRATRSPIRLIHFWRQPDALDRYLAATGESPAAYAGRIGASMGRSARLMLSTGCAKPMEVDNTTSEGELVDFEHVWNGWYWGHPMPPCYCFETIHPAFREMRFVLGAESAEYERAFARELCGSALAVAGGPAASAREAVSRFLGGPIADASLVAPVVDGVRAKLLEDWDRALRFYRYIEAQPAAFRDLPEARFLVTNLPALIALTEDDIERMRLAAREASDAMNVYDYPAYYEVAFGFRDLPREVDFFERLIRRYSRVPVTRVLELASGFAPHLPEWHRRGYQYTGLDINPVMRRFARRRARELGVGGEFVHGSTRRLDLGGRRFEFAYVQLGSLYVDTNRQFLQHLDALAAALPSGALYVLDGVVQFKLVGEPRQQWTMRQRGVVVKTTYEQEVLDAFEQRIRERLVLEVADHGRRRTIDGRLVRKVIYPQELILLVARQDRFELVGWYNNFRAEHPKNEKGRRQIVLRRR